MDISNNVIKANDIFQAGHKWLNKKHLVEAVEIFAAKTGWHPCSPYNTVIKCNCYKKPLPTTQKQRNFSSGDNHKGCGFQITFKSTQYSVVASKKSGNKKSVAVLASSTPVIITDKCSYKHSGTCSPSQKERDTIF